MNKTVPTMSSAAGKLGRSPTPLAGCVIDQTSIDKPSDSVGNQKSRWRIGVDGCNQKIVKMLPTKSILTRQDPRLNHPMSKQTGSRINMFSKVKAYPVRCYLG